MQGLIMPRNSAGMEHGPFIEDLPEGSDLGIKAIRIDGGFNTVVYCSYDINILQTCIISRDDLRSFFLSILMT